MVRASPQPYGCFPQTLAEHQVWALGLPSAGGGLASGSWEKPGVSVGAGQEEGWKDRAEKG